MDDKYTVALAAAQAFLMVHRNFADTREVRCITPFSDGAQQLDLGTVRALVELAQLGAAEPDVTFRGRCSRCGAEPAPNLARSICEDCDLDTPLCEACYIAHAREILTDPAYQHPDAVNLPSTRVEKLKLAARIVAEAGWRE